MSDLVWLLVENIDKTKYPAYEIVSVDPTIGNNREIRTGKMISMRDGDDRSIVRRISASKKEVQKFKASLELEDEKNCRSVTECIQTAKNRKRDVRFKVRPSTSRNLPSTSRHVPSTSTASRSTFEDTSTVMKRSQSSDESSSDYDIKDPAKLGRLYEQLETLILRTGRNPSSSKPLLGSAISRPRKQYRHTQRTTLAVEKSDRGTQTNESGPMPDYDKVAADLRLLKSLIAEAQYRWYKMLSTAKIKVSIEDGEPTNLVELNLFSADLTLKRENSSQSVREVSAHATDGTDDNESDDFPMVPSGSGRTQPPKMIQDIDYSCYQTATRELLGFIFHPKELATQLAVPTGSKDGPQPLLEMDVINDVVSNIRDKCGSWITDEMVRSCILEKCNEEAELMRKSQQNGVAKSDHAS